MKGGSQIDPSPEKTTIKKPSLNRVKTNTLFNIQLLARLFQPRLRFIFMTNGRNFITNGRNFITIRLYALPSKDPAYNYILIIYILLYCIYL